MDSKNISLKYIILGGFFVLGSFIVFGVLMVNIFTSSFGGNNKMIVPGISEIELNEAGNYVIYHEHRTTYEDKIYYDSNIEGMLFVVTDINDRRRINLKEPKLGGTYQINGNEGYSIFEFEILEPTTIRIETTYEGNDGQESVINIRKSIFKDLFLRIIYMLLSIFVVGGIGIGLIIVGFVKRQKQKKEKINYNY